jgi:5-carboxymethyl-2-hydroxymuconate isomerase
MRNRRTVKILKHHRTSDVYVDGRYLHVSMKISLKSKRGREVAQETAETIMLALTNDQHLRDAIEADDPL